MARLAEAFIGLHADGDPFEREVGPAVKKGAELAEDDLEVAGQKWGEVLADSSSDELKKSGPKFAKGIEDGLRGQRVKVKGIKFEVDKSGNIGRRWVSLVTEEIEEAFKQEAASGGRGGIFSRIQTAFADAIGAGFNISGRSPLVAFLIPLVGVIAGLILGAVQAVNALIAALVAVPAAIAGIVVSAGVLMIAFEGVGTAIQGAFAAKNAKELNAALEGLTPAAKAFVRSLLPLKDFFTDLKTVLQEAFFVQIFPLFGPGGTLTPLLDILRSQLPPVASALGMFADNVAKAFGSPEFQEFVKALLPELAHWLRELGPDFRIFLRGLSDLGTFALPFLSFLGREMNENFRLLGEFFSDLKDDPGARQWLEDMEVTFRKVEVLITEVLKFIVAFFDTLNKAGGDRVLDAFSEAFDRLTFFLSTDVGQKAMEGLISLSIASIQAFTGLLILILLIIAGIEKLGEIAALIARVVSTGLAGLWGDITEFFSGLVETIVGWFARVPRRLEGIGREMISSLARGITSMVGFLGSAVASVLTRGLFNFLPQSPAKEGPLSGKGDPMISGRTIMDRLAAGMSSGLPEVRNVSSTAATTINFGPGAISVGFEGAVPTPAQARTTGSAVGQGILGLLNRDAALGVRSLAPMGG